MAKSGKRRNWLVQILFDPLIGRLLKVAIILFIFAPWCQILVNLHGEKAVLAMEATARFFLSPEFGPDDVLLSPDLEQLAGEEEISEDDLRSIIAAAASEEDIERGIERFTFAADLLGLAKTETSYCHNIGGGIAKTEIETRLAIEQELERRGEPNSAKFFEAQVGAIDTIANRIGVDVLSIPGSVGAGAISCFQLMPSNWLEYGGGDYRDTFSAALNAARFLKAHGYPDPAAIGSYNPNAGQEYVDGVLANAEIWHHTVDTALVITPEPLNKLTLILVYTEYLAWYMNPNGGFTVGGGGGTGGVPPVIEGLTLVHPHPGSHPCGNWFGRVIGSYVHWGQDFCKGGATGEVLAAHDCAVTVSELIPRRSNDAIVWSSSGYTVVCAAILPDGRVIESIYGHLKATDMPAVGTILSAGDHLATTSCLGDPDVEYCSGHHLHFGIRVDGTLVNPLPLLE